MDENLKAIKRAIPHQDWQAAKAAAALEDITIPEWILLAIREKIAQDKR